MKQNNVDREDILNIIDSVRELADKLRVNKEQSQKLQNEINEHYESFRDAIIRVYEQK